MSKYFWPASRLGEQEMEMLYRARESAAQRTTIAQLVAEAVRQAYGQVADESATMEQPGGREAA